MRLGAKEELQRMVDEEKMSKAYLLELAYGAKNSSDTNFERVTGLFKTALGKNSLSGLELADLNKVFEIDSEIHAIRYKRAFGKILGSKRDFVIMKGQVGQ